MRFTPDAAVATAPPAAPACVTAAATGPVSR